MKNNKLKLKAKRLRDEIKEDLLFAKIAEQRMRQKVKWVPHDKAWKNHVRP